MDPLEKEKVLHDKREWKNRWYSSLNPEDKEKLLSDRAEWYSSLNPEDKEKLLSDRAQWYNSLQS